MTTLAINGAEIFFTDQGSGDGVILVHGFAASAEENWAKAGWIHHANANTTNARKKSRARKGLAWMSMKRRDCGVGFRAGRP